MKQFFNRDLSWIEFNARILEEGCRKDNPIMERMKFLAIVSTNFDEFFQVRVASIKRLIESHESATDVSGEKFSDILHKISVRTHELVRRQYETLISEIMPALSEHGIEYVPPEQFTDQQNTYTQNLFKNTLFPLLTPLRSEGNHEQFPHITNQSVNVYFKLAPINGIHTENAIIKPDVHKTYSAVVQIPKGLDRIVWLPTEKNKKSFALIDDIITIYGTNLFPGYKVEDSMVFSVARDADMGVDEEAGSQFIEAMKEVIENRRSAGAIRMVCNCKNEQLLHEAMQKLGLKNDDVYLVNGLIHPEVLLSLTKLPEAKSMSFEPWNHFKPKKLSTENLWSYLKNNDVILNLPYESFEPVVRLVKDAAEDPDVLAIKITLYRTESKSEIIKSLIKAANNGKQVTAFVELKARFDEQKNIDWAGKLERAGVIVIYGIVNLKVHGKTLMVIRKEEDGIRRYVHLSTGNYNADTAKIYSDFSFFTSNPEIAGDITLFFNTISGYSVLQTMQNVYMAPVDLKKKLLSLIRRETEISEPENPGLIIAKMNSLGDEEIVNALYDANRAGVRIFLNVRGICQLVPGIQNQSENITVVSIVGRYLEHSRIFYFKNGGEERIFLSSADWMPRNLDRRVELMFPIKDRNIFATIKETLEAYFKDNTHAHKLQPDGNWLPVRPKDNEKPFCAQNALYEKYKKAADLERSDSKLEFEIRRNK